MGDASDLKGVVVGITVLIVLRLLDYFLPKGWRFKQLERYASKNEEEKDSK